MCCHHYHDLKINGSGGNFPITTGDLVVGGDLSISAGTLDAETTISSVPCRQPHNRKRGVRFTKRKWGILYGTEPEPQPWYDKNATTKQDMGIVFVLGPNHFDKRECQMHIDDYCARILKHKPVTR